MNVWDDIPETGGEVDLASLATPPKATPPPDDLPPPERGLDWTVEDLQKAVDMHVLSLFCARHEAAVIGLDPARLRDSATGYAWPDRKRHFLARARLIHRTLETYAPASKCWPDGSSRAKSYKFLENEAREIVREIQEACPDKYKSV